MPQKLFAMTSTLYCIDCGSFDLVKLKQSNMGARLQGAQPLYRCCCCGRKQSDVDLSKNMLLTLPTHPSDYFFPRLKPQPKKHKRPLKPVAAVMGVSIISAAIYALYIVELPKLNTLKPVANIEWTKASSTVFTKDELSVVEALTLEFEEVVKDKKIPVQ